MSVERVASDQMLFSTSIILPRKKNLASDISALQDFGCLFVLLLIPQLGAVFSIYIYLVNRFLESVSS